MEPGHRRAAEIRAIHQAADQSITGDDKMTNLQHLAVQALIADGFAIHQAAKAVRMFKGNDYRLVMADGSQKRAKGARR